MSVNKVILLGNVGRDPEVRYLDTGVAVATFPLATSDRADISLHFRNRLLRNEDEYETFNRWN